MRRLVLITLIVTMILFLLPEPVLTQAFAQNYDSKISEYEIIADDSSDEFTAGVFDMDASTIPIYTVEDLRAIENNMNGSYILMNDIDLSSYNGGEWNPIGSYKDKFTGTFDGQGHVIKSLQKTESESYGSLGLFNTLGDCTFKNLSIELGSIGLNGNNSTGSIAGTFESSDFENGKGLIIINCYVEGKVTGQDCVGGFVGEASGNTSIHGSYVKGSIIAKDGISLGGGFLGDVYGKLNVIDGFFEGSILAESGAGGIIGNNKGAISSSIIEDCTVRGEITVSGKTRAEAGGIVGSGIRQNISNCYSYADVTVDIVDDGDSGGYSGGIIGYVSDGTISECYSYGKIKSLNSYATAGGIAGYSSMEITVKSCAAYGNVEAISGENKSAYAGGIIGHGQVNISDCSYEADVSARTIGEDFQIATAGGIAGEASNSIFKDCKTIGNVTTESDMYACSGGIVGKGWGNNNITSCQSSAAIRAISKTKGKSGQHANAGGLTSDFLQDSVGTIISSAFTGSADASDDGDSVQAYAFAAGEAIIRGSVYNSTSLPLAVSWEGTGGDVTLPDGKVIIGNSEDIDYDSDYENYYSENKSGKYFRIMVAGETYPQTKGFYVTVNGIEYYTGPTKNDIYLNIPEGYTGTVKFSCDGFYTYELPVNLVKAYNFIMLDRVTDNTKPLIQAIYVKTATSLTNLRVFNSLSLYTNDLSQYEVIVHLNWKGQSEDEVWLEQGNIKIPVTDNSTGLITLASLLKPNGGALYVCAKNINGEITRKPINVEVYERESTYNLEIIDSESITSPNNIEFLANTKLDFSITGSIPVSFDINQDGTFKAVFGLQVKGDKTKQMFGSVKDAYEAFKNDYVGADINGEIERILKADDVLASDIFGTFGFKTKAKVLGFGEGKVIIDNGMIKLDFTDTGFIVSVKGEVKGTQQYLLVYGKTELATTAEFAFKLSDLVALEPALNIKATVDVTIGGGLGVPDVVSGGLSGTGSLTMDSTIPKFGSNLDVYSRYSYALGEITLLGLKLTIHTHESDKYYWIKDGEWAFGESSSDGSSNFMETEYKQIPRGYLDAESYFLANQASADLTEQDFTASSIVFKSNSYPAATPQIAELSDGKRIMVWIEDDGGDNRPIDENRTALYYSVYNDTVWSEPQIVHQDYTADFYPKLNVINDSIYLLWMNASQEFSGGESISDIAKAMNIYVAAFNTINNNFDNISCVHSDSDTLNMLADITMVHENPVIAWINNTAGDINCVDGVTSLWKSEWDGTKWTSAELASAIGAVDSLSVAGEGSLAIYFSKDTDGNIDTIDDKEIFKYYNGKIDQLTINDVADTKPKYINDKLIYYNDGEIIVENDAAEFSINTDRFQYLAGDNGVDAIVYLEAGDNFTTLIYAVFNDGVGWGKPIVVSEIDGYVTGYSAVMLSNGALYIAVNSIDTITSIAEIKLYEIVPYCDIKVTAVDYYSHSMTDGGELAISVDVQNTGTEAVHYIHVTVSDENDSELSSMVFLESLLSGDICTLNLLCPLPEDYSNDKLKIKVMPLDYIDQNIIDNEDTLMIYRNDLSIEDICAFDYGEKTVVSGVIVNRGLDAFENITVRLKIGSLEAEDYMVKNISLSPQEACSVDFEIDKINYISPIYLVSDKVENENIISNNSIMTLVQPLTASDDSIATSIRIDGENSIIVPDDGTINVQYTATALNQYGNVIELPIAWSTTSSAIGVSFDTSTGILTVDSTAGASGAVYFTIIAQSGSLKESKTIVISRKAATNIEVDWTPIIIKSSITYGDTKESAFIELPSTGVAAATIPLDGKLSIVNADEILTAGDNKCITVKFTVTSEGDYQGIEITKDYIIDVEPKEITVTVAPAYREYGAPNPVFTISVEEGALVGSDTIEDLNLSLTTTAENSSAPGKYSVTGTADNSNYIVSVLGTNSLTITKAVTPDVNIIYLEYNNETPIIEENIDLAALLPNDCSDVNFSLSNSGAAVTTGAAIDANGILTFSIAGGNDGDKEEFFIDVIMQNYEDVTIKIVITLVDKVKPIGNPVVTGSLIYGQKLSSLPISIIMKDKSGNIVDGTITWKYHESIPVAGKSEQMWVFTPDNEEIYSRVHGTASIIVEKCVPSGAPTYTKITADGKTIAEANIGGVFINPYSSEVVPGKLSWDVEYSIIVKANVSYGWTFTPDDIKNYDIAEGTIRLYTKKSDTSGPSTTKPEKASVEAGMNDIESWDNPFTDVDEGDWFYEAVKFVNINGLMDDMGNSKFEPHTTLSRAMLVTVLWRLEGKPTMQSNNTFTDLSQEWYVEAVIWANENGIVLGYGDGIFGPNDELTREQMVTMLYRYSQYKGQNVSARVDLGGYTDADNISSWALSAMEWANAEGLITGRTSASLASKGTATRSELATIIMRYLSEKTE